MLDFPKFSEHNDEYDGSRTFTWLADLCGLSVDLINFLICQISALFLASLFRSILHPSKVSSVVRHIFALTLGLVFGYFCFGKQAIHMAGLPAACYVVIRVQSPAVVQRSVMLVAMTYLLCMHLTRQIYDYGSYALDITGPLMIITQKVTSLAYNIHDGFVSEQENATTSQAVYKLPTALEYFSYVLHFQGLMAGPLVFYKDYIDFIEGYNLLKTSTIPDGDYSKARFILEPSPMKAVIKKVIGSMVCAFIFMKFVQIYPVKAMKDDEFLENTTMVYKLWYAMMATSCTRFKYYHAWLLADAICNNSGLGFTGYDKDGNSKWDLISNINVLRFEFATNMRDAINSWNCGTNRWLRTVVYNRVPKRYGTMLTFALSAVWHGFYPGYYLTFTTGALMVTSARMARRLFRHRFQQTQFTRMFYDIVTCLVTRLVMGYATFPFVLLEFMGSLRLYLKFFMCLHIIALVNVFVLPIFIARNKNNSDSSSNMNASTGVACKIAQQADDFSHISPGTTTTVAAQVRPSLTSIGMQMQLRAAIAKNNTTNAEWGADIIDAHVMRDCTATNYETDNVATTTTTTTTTISPSPTRNVSKLEFKTASASVKHDQCEMEQLSNKLKEKIDAETKSIEQFIDRTVTETVSGIAEFKKDLMRDTDDMFGRQEGVRKRCTKATMGTNNNAGNEGNDNDFTNKAAEETGAFLKKEIEAINAVVQQANVLPVVLSNGHCSK